MSENKKQIGEGNTKKRRLGMHIFIDRVVVAFLILFQITIILTVLIGGSHISQFIAILLSIISFVVALSVVVDHNKPEFKLLWVFLILALPVFGGLFYLIFSIRSHTRALSQMETRVAGVTDAKTEGSVALAERVCKKYPNRQRQILYITQSAGFPLFEEGESKYLPTGEEFYLSMLEDISKAEKYIFLEYFIIAEGTMWDGILDALKKKAAEGVEVRLIYDDLGCLTLLPRNYAKTLEKFGIKCRSFNRFRPFLTGIQNNRDHRKICVIDGVVGYTGGINLGDEYINERERFGHWKDTAVRVTGESAWGLAVIFFRMWMMISQMSKGELEDISSYKPCIFEGERGRGYVQPYCDSPFDGETVSEDIYMQMINSARRYVYIFTPYLIIGRDMVSALMLAARSGVDVRIVTPRIADKKLVHMATRSNYRTLISSGVKIYEYTPGFVHAKVVLCDGEVASVGTANFDYRSLYLHFECGAVLYASDAIADIKRDFDETFLISERICENDKICRPRRFGRFLSAMLRLISPML